MYGTIFVEKRVNNYKTLNMYTIKIYLFQINLNILLLSIMNIDIVLNVRANCVYVLIFNSNYMFAPPFLICPHFLNSNFMFAPLLNSIT